MAPLLEGSLILGKWDWLCSSHPACLIPEHQPKGSRQRTLHGRATDATQVSAMLLSLYVPFLPVPEV